MCRISNLPFSRITATIGGPDAHVTAIYYTIKVRHLELSILIPIIDARKITDVLLNKDIGHDQLSFDEMERSAYRIGKHFGRIISQCFKYVHIDPFCAYCSCTLYRHGWSYPGECADHLGMVSDYVLFIKTDFKYLGNHALGNLYFCLKLKLYK